MKDLEKIKSEDLGCQVADANPGNFAIEQEVAQLVGATVPAPTEPSADDARELGAQLLVFLRRALLPIRSALRTAVAAIYAHLDSRCTDYTPAAYASYIPRPYDPMTTPRVPRTLPNLLTAITAFAPRKISAECDAVPDGVSLANLLSNSAVAATMDRYVDTNHGWAANRAGWLNDFLNKFPNVTYAVFDCEIGNTKPMTSSVTRTMDEVHIKSKNPFDSIGSVGTTNLNADLYYDDVETLNQGGRNEQTTIAAKRIFIPKMKSGTFCIGFSAGGTNSYTTYLYIGCMGSRTELINIAARGSAAATQALNYVEVREGARQPIRFWQYNDQIPAGGALNFNNISAESLMEGIFYKLADNSYEADGVTEAPSITITIGRVLYAKLSDEQKAYINNKNYTLSTADY